MKPTDKRQQTLCETTQNAMQNSPERNEKQAKTQTERGRSRKVSHKKRLKTPPLHAQKTHTDALPS